MKYFKPGPKPLEYKVIVFPDPVSEQEEGSIMVKPIQVMDNERRMRTRGILVDFSDMAFSDWKCDKPSRGDVVEFSMYAGQFFNGDDGKEYRIMNDKDLVAFWGK